MRPEDGQSRILRGCLLVLLAVVCYAPAYNAGFVFDDAIYVTGDERLETAGGLWRIWTEPSGGSDGYKHQWYPMTGTVLWVEHALWGLSPFGYHFVNVLLHALNAIILWRLLARLGLGAGAAWVTGAVFALHPLHVASVAWVSELKNVLSTALFLGAAWCMTRWWEKEPGSLFAAKKEPGSLFYAIGVLLFVGALLSKTATCLLPVALLIAWWWKQGQIGRRELIGVLPLAVIGAVLVAVTVHIESSYAAKEIAGASAAEKWLVCGRSAWFYATKIAFPAGLMMIYPRWEIDAWTWWQHVYPVSVVGAVAALWVLSRRVGRGPAAAAAYFVAAVIPVSLVTVAFARLSWVADHWAYWGSMGLIALVVGGAAWLLSRVPRGREIAAALSCVVLGTLGAFTWQRARIFETPESLWRHTVTHNPGCWEAWYNLGVAIADDGRPEEALACYQRAWRIDPSAEKVHNNLGTTLHDLDRTDEAIAHYRQAVGLEPRFAVAHTNLGSALQAQGCLDGAIEQYHRALALTPAFAGAHFNLGIALRASGRLGESIEHLGEAVRLEPNAPAAHDNLAAALRDQGDLAAAELHFRHADELRAEMIPADAP